EAFINGYLNANDCLFNKNLSFIRIGSLLNFNKINPALKYLFIKVYIIVSIKHLFLLFKKSSNVLQVIIQLA
ncbi:hypothetical protein ACL15Z_001756, partial [Campylobacter jejuni]